MTDTGSDSRGRREREEGASGRTRICGAGDRTPGPPAGKRALRAGAAAEGRGQVRGAPRGRPLGSCAERVGWGGWRDAAAAAARERGRRRGRLRGRGPGPGAGTRAGRGGRPMWVSAAAPCPPPRPRCGRPGPARGSRLRAGAGRGLAAPRCRPRPVLTLGVLARRAPSLPTPRGCVGRGERGRAATGLDPTTAPRLESAGKERTWLLCRT